MTFVDPPFSYKKKRIRIDITLPPDLLQRVRDYCERKRLPVSYVIQMALEEYLKEG